MEIAIHIAAYFAGFLIGVAIGTGILWLIESMRERRYRKMRDKHFKRF